MDGWMQIVFCLSIRLLAFVLPGCFHFLVFLCAPAFLGYTQLLISQQPEKHLVAICPITFEHMQYEHCMLKGLYHRQFCTHWCKPTHVKAETWHFNVAYVIWYHTECAEEQSLKNKNKNKINFLTVWSVYANMKMQILLSVTLNNGTACNGCSPIHTKSTPIPIQDRSSMIDWHYLT